jgi:hypothetical protein
MASLIHCDLDGCERTAPGYGTPYGWVRVGLAAPAVMKSDVDRVFCTSEHAATWLAKGREPHDFEVARVVRDAWRKIGRRMYGLGFLAAATGVVVGLLLGFMLR